ncbi:hypothetical protein [Streptomyces sp. cg35]|uniref:hypothetical protein n=1 Tax=Streptomyces sp. cg35 TaxID=3421650 RepID=UPI003D178721
MDAALTSAALLLLITVTAHVIQRRNTQHAEGTTLRTYHRVPPDHRAPTDPGGGGPPPPTLPPGAPADRHDHRDGGRGRFPARRRRDRTTHKQAR